jgi:hypothetical protein
VGAVVGVAIGVAVGVADAAGVAGALSASGSLVAVGDTVLPARAVLELLPAQPRMLIAIPMQTTDTISRDHGFGVCAEQPLSGAGTTSGCQACPSHRQRPSSETRWPFTCLRIPSSSYT